MLDYQPDPEFVNLRVAVTQGGLWKMGQLSQREISMIVEYYLLNLKNHEFVMEFVRQNGFENLDRLIARVSADHHEG